jgi:hypothetical protein
MKLVFIRAQNKDPVIKPLCAHLDKLLYPAWRLTFKIDQFRKFAKISYFHSKMAHGFTQMRRILTDKKSVKIFKIRVIRVLFLAIFFVKKVPKTLINTESSLQRSR